MVNGEVDGEQQRHDQHKHNEMDVEAQPSIHLLLRSEELFVFIHARRFWT
jgi:hypothetical protein